jgi:hypothetical protein
MVRNTLCVVSFAIFELLVTFSEAVAYTPLRGGGGGGGGSGSRVAILVALITTVGAIVAALISRSNSQK